MPETRPSASDARSAVGASGVERRSIDAIRTLAMDAVEAAQSGHPGTPMALAPLAYALWTRVMRYAPSDPRWPDRDRFVLSAGHASMLLYASLHLAGYDLSLDDLRAFRQWGSRTPGHPESHVTPGVETTTGPLGQGIGNAVGLALAERMLAARFNREGFEVVDHRTWCIASDGDLMEGVASEAASLAGHLGLSRLCVFWDDNRITIDGGTPMSFTEDVGMRFEAYGWNVLRLADTATVEEVVRAADAARAETSRPTLVVCRTHIGWGSPNKQDTSKAHGEPLGKDEIRLTKERYGWPVDPPFLVPDDVRRHMRDVCARGEPVAAGWKSRLLAYRAAFPAEARTLEDALSGRLPAGCFDALLAAGKSLSDVKAMSTRKASGLAIHAIAGAVPSLVGGSADLAGSNQTAIKGGGDVQRGAYAGRNLWFGVREHGMGAVLNGLALHGGFRPFGGTFLIFSDYMRPSIRLAALMGLRVVYVFTHDSIGVGEDGPTHQPVEQLASLRAIPGLHVLRPCDAAETLEAWRFALSHDGPVALSLTRQDLPVLARASSPATKTADARGFAAAGGLLGGAYVLREAAGGPPEVILVATGSEVQHAVAAQDALAEKGVRARVVSMPCTTLFAARAAAERDAVLPPLVPRVVIEAATSFGWDRYVGERGTGIFLDHFGASAPGGRLMREFGFTPENVVAAGLSLVRPRA